MRTTWLTVCLALSLAQGCAHAQSINVGPPPASSFKLPTYPNAPRTSNDVPNLDEVKSRLREYYASGNYDKEVGEVVKAARKFMEDRAGKVTRPALVLDVDDTAVSNLPYFSRHDFALLSAPWKEWAEKGEAPAIVSVGNLFRWARAQNVTVFFVSGRLESSRALTEKMLKNAGYDDFTLILKPDPQSETPMARFKPEKRRWIQDQGYTILANVGDQQSDLEGGYAEKTFKIPNPIYVVP